MGNTLIMYEVKKYFSLIENTYDIFNIISWTGAQTKLTKIFIYMAQSFTSLKADLHQVINGGFVFSRYLNGTFP